MEKWILKKPEEERITEENSHGLKNLIQSQRRQKDNMPEEKQGKNI